MINFRWPATKDNLMVPWYTILYRLPFFAVMHVGFILAWFAILMTGGLREANQWWLSQ